MGLFNFFKKKSKQQQLEDIIKEYKQVVNEHKSDVVYCDTTSPEYDKKFHSLIESSFFFYPQKSTNGNEIEFFVAPKEKFTNENSQRGQIAIFVFEWLQLTYAKNSNLYSQVLSLFVEEEKTSIQEHLSYIQTIIKNDSLTQIIRDTKILKAISERLRAYNKIINHFSNSLMHLFSEHENEIEQFVEEINNHFPPTEKITEINNLTTKDVESIFLRDMLSGKNLLEYDNKEEDNDFAENMHKLEVIKIRRCIDVANEYLQKNDYQVNDYSIDGCYDLISLWKEKGLPAFFHWSGADGGGCSGFNEKERIKCIVEWYNILTGKEITEKILQRYLSGLSGGMYEKEMSAELLKDFNFNLFEIVKQNNVNQDDTNPSKSVDENEEPSVLKHNCSPERIGKEMRKEELHKFAVEYLSKLYERAGMIIVDINRNYNREFPNIVMKSRNGKFYYIIIETTSYPQKAESLYSADFTEIKQYAKEFNATPVFAGLSFMNASRDDLGKMICGDSYFVAFKGLEAI